MRPGTDGTVTGGGLPGVQQAGGPGERVGEHRPAPTTTRPWPINWPPPPGPTSGIATTGYFMEYAVPNDVASSASGLARSAASVPRTTIPALTPAPRRSTAFWDTADIHRRPGRAAGASEWAADGQTTGAWIQVNLSTPTAINSVTLYNRTATTLAALRGNSPPGILAFSDGTTVPVTFNAGQGSRRRA